MAGLYSGPVMLDYPATAERRPSYAAESWLEPWLIKHSGFYRNHFTRDGRQESKSARRQSVVSEGLASRKNSVAPSVEASGAVPTEASPAPAAVEQDKEISA
jgi:hypothetical protein